ncbi:MAG: hypothetical protein L0H29_06515, partial [Sinobacteraceae bacterium]|nr:hypothetical protein [Nevskiaceae bacterium]
MWVEMARVPLRRHAHMRRHTPVPPDGEVIPTKFVPGDGFCRFATKAAEPLAASTDCVSGWNEPEVPVRFQ